MTKTQKNLIEKVYVSTRCYRNLKSGVNRKFVNLQKLNEINQAYKLEEAHPDKFETKTHCWRSVDLIEKK